MLAAYEKGEGDQEGFLKHARFRLYGQGFMAMDSSRKHDFNFNEAISLLVLCDSQEEIDRYWTALSADPRAERCGWLKDGYGVSWQISPRIMGEMLSKGTEEQKKRVTQAFLKMKKFDIATIRKAFEG
jgi:predicted 3-demethylubiquinone-9 3-methyltransferase (glyoxalase superfamily)